MSETVPDQQQQVDGVASPSNVPGGEREQEPEKSPDREEEHGDRKRDRDETLEQWEAKRRRDMNYTHQMWQACAAAMNQVVGVMKEVLKTIEGQQDVGSAIMASEQTMAGNMEKLTQSIGATESGIQYYASQLAGFKAEIKNHFREMKKLFGGIAWDYLQTGKRDSPMHQYMKTQYGHILKKIDEIADASSKSVGQQALIVAELQKLNMLLQDKTVQQQLGAGKRSVDPSLPSAVGATPMQQVATGGRPDTEKYLQGMFHRHHVSIRPRWPPCNTGGSTHAGDTNHPVTYPPHASDVIHAGICRAPSHCGAWRSWMAA